MLKRAIRLAAILLALLFAFAGGWLVSATGMASRVDPATLPELERRFVDGMRGARLVGRFTLAGREDRAPAPDSYEIDSVEKVGEDRWRFNARIGEYGNNMTLPIVLTLRWVDDTPIIMMTDVTIPSVGTFTSRVFFYGDRYAGTWQHGERGGHLFGRIEKAASRE
jgi:hypothetical protein